MVDDESSAQESSKILENSSNKEPHFCFLGEGESVLVSLAEAFASESLAPDIFLNSSCTASFAMLFDILLEKTCL